MTPAYFISILLDRFLCVLFTACLPEDEECSNADQRPCGRLWNRVYSVGDQLKLTAFDELASNDKVGLGDG